MKFSSARRFGFTLVEVMVAMVILVLILGLLLQVVDGVLQSSQAMNQQMDATQAARRALDVMARDIRHAVVDSSATILVGQAGAPASLAFLTQSRGPTGSNARFLAVGYTLTHSPETPATTLERRYEAITWPTASLLAVTMPGAGATISEVGPSVLAINIQVLLEDGSRVNANVSPGNNEWGIDGNARFHGQEVPAKFTALVPATPRTRENLTAATARATALEITLVAVDPQSYTVLDATGALATIRTAFAAPTNPLSSTATQWNQTVNTINLPGPARNGLRVLSKTVPLP